MDTFSALLALEDVTVPVIFLVLARKVVLTLIGPLKIGLEWRHNGNSLIPAPLQSRLPSFPQIRLIRTAQPQSSLPSSKRIKLIPLTWLQSRLPNCKRMKLIIAALLWGYLPSSDQIKPIPRHSCRAAYQVLNKATLFPSTAVEQPAKNIEKSNLFWQHKFGAACQVLRKSHISTAQLQIKLSQVLSESRLFT